MAAIVTGTGFGFDQIAAHTQIAGNDPAGRAIKRAFGVVDRTHTGFAQRPPRRLEAGPARRQHRAPSRIGTGTAGGTPGRRPPQHITPTDCEGRGGPRVSTPILSPMRSTARRCGTER